MARTGKASLLIVFMTVFIDLLGFGIVLPLLPRYGEHFDADALLGPLMASFSAMQFVFAPIWGRISDRVGRRPILIVGLAGSTLFYALFGVATSLGVDGTLLGLSALAWLFISRIGAGVAGATIPVAQAYIADATDVKGRAKGMALIGMAFGLGFAFGPLIGAAFAPEELGAPPSPAPGYVASALSGLAMLSAIFLLPESLRPDSKPAARKWLDLDSLRVAVARPLVGLLLTMIFLTTFAFAQFESTLALLTQRFGLGQRDNFYVFAYIGAVLLVSQGVIYRRLVPRFGEFRMGLAGVVLMTLGLLAIGASAFERSVLLLLAVLPVTVLGVSFLTPSLFAMLSFEAGESEQGGILGTGQSVSALARILGPWIGIRLFQLEITLPFWEAAGLMAAAVLLLLPLRAADSSRVRKAAEA